MIVKKIEEQEQQSWTTGQTPNSRSTS